MVAMEILTNLEVEVEEAVVVAVEVDVEEVEEAGLETEEALVEVEGEEVWEVEALEVAEEEEVWEEDLETGALAVVDLVEEALEVTLGVILEAISVLAVVAVVEVVLDEVVVEAEDSVAVWIKGLVALVEALGQPVVMMLDLASVILQREVILKRALK